MTLVRTPEERFQALPDFPFTPRYMTHNGARVHYVDEGQGEVVLCLHGEPTWAYLYRKMIPPLAARCRVLAMDFIGFGRSDKYTAIEDYSFALHRDTLVGFIEALDLRDITLVVQDWGGLIGLAVAMQTPERFARLVIMNTGLATGDVSLGEPFERWREFAVRLGTRLPIGRIVRGGLARGEAAPDAVIAAYDAPFPDASYKAGAAAFPLLVPVGPDDPGAAELRATRDALSRWTKPALVLFSDGDPITKAGRPFFRRLIPSAKDQPRIVIKNAGHFLQEEKGEEIAGHILAFIDRTPNQLDADKPGS